MIMNKSATKTPTAAADLIPESALSSNGEPQWLRELRQTSRQEFNGLPLPRRGLALWKYTDPGTFLIDADQLVEEPSCKGCRQIAIEDRFQVQSNDLAAFATDCCGREIEVQHGKELGEKVVLCSLSSALDKYEDLVRDHLGKLVNSQTGKFEALNSAMWRDGLFVYVPDNTNIEKPLHLMRHANLGGASFFPRLLVVLGRNSRLTLIDEYTGGSSLADQSYTTMNGAVEIFGAADSQCHYVSLQRLGSGTRMYLTHRTRLERGARSVVLPVAIGGGITKQNFGVLLNGEGAESSIYGLLFGAKRQQFDIHTLHHHSVGRTTSNIDFKVVLRDKARSAYTGLIRIDQQARGCEAYQENRNLLLNAGTRAETIPELEILNEDVQCSHGATIGPVDPEMLFYLEARGINPRAAIDIVVSGFVASTLKHIPEDLRDRISNVILQRLEVS